MNLRSMLVELFRAMEWSDARMWTSIRKTPGAATDKSILEKAHHFHMVQRAFLSVWRGTPEYPPKLDTFADALALEAWARTYYAEAHDFVASLDDAALERPIALPWADRLIGGSAAVPTLGETVMQVAMHSAHHRAQVSSRIRELGGEPLLVDYILWIWSGKPAPQWP